MKFSSGGEEKWASGRQLNDDPYGSAVYDFAERWANLMEEEMNQGKSLQHVMKTTESKADEDIGITGFMYGCAIGILSECWIHGEDLRRLHNLEYNLHGEGKRANEKGTVINPAIITIEVP